MRRMSWLAAAVCSLSLLLTGCFFHSADDLYQMPVCSAGNENLDRQIKQEMAALGVEYGTSVEFATIVSGDNTSTVQLQDLDGDGHRETAFTFFRVPGADKPLKIYCFTQVSEDEYQVTDIVEGVGSAISAVHYVDLDGQGRKDLVVGWQVSGGVNQLGAYSLDKYDFLHGEVALADGPVSQTLRTEPEPVSGSGSAGSEQERQRLLADELLLAAYSDYALLDADQDNRTEIVILQLDAVGTSSMAGLYAWQDGGMIQMDSAPLSDSIATINKTQSNYLAGEIHTPALYVTSTLTDGQRAVDVLAYQEGDLRNLTLDSNTGVSREVVQGYIETVPTDINGDSVLELPSPTQLPTYGDGASYDFWLLTWNQYDSTGARTEIFTTYHNVSDGWYLIIPDSWRDRITISRNDATSGQRAVIFSLWNGPEKPPSPFLVIYKLTGVNSSSRATTGGRFMLWEDEDAIYAAAFYTTDWDSGLNENSLRESFHLIETSWLND